MPRKVSLIGGGGVRTQLLIHGMLQEQSTLQVGELHLYDVDRSRAETMAPSTFCVPNSISMRAPFN